QGVEGPAGAAGTTSYAALTGVPTTFAPSTHMHLSTQLSDSTAAGRAILTAADASAMRGYLNTGKAVVGVAPKFDSFRVYKNATVVAGVAVFYLTDDGLMTGNALYSEVF